MPSFPSLTSFTLTEDVLDSWEEGVVTDPTLKDPKEGGYVTTRAKFTRIPRFFKYSFPYYSAADKATLFTFERTTVVMGTSSFTWLNPIDGNYYTVRFEEPVEYKPNKGTVYWEITIRVAEV